MDHVPPVRHSQSDPQQARSQWRYGRVWRRTATLIGAATLASFILPSGLGDAAPGQPMPSLQSLVARARVLSNEINTLDEQYNGLRIQLSQARYRGAGRAAHLRPGHHPAQRWPAHHRPARGPELYEQRAGHIAGNADEQQPAEPARPCRDHAAASARERRPDRPDGRGGRGGAAGPGNREAAGQDRGPSGRGDGRQAAGSPEEDQHSQQRRLRQGHGRLQPDRPVSQHRHPHHQLDRRARPCGSR